MVQSPDPMPTQTTLLRILRASAPAAVRLIALAAVALGRHPIHHREAGVSRASWYRHRDAAIALFESQAEKNQERRPSLAETISHSPVDNSAGSSTPLAQPKAQRSPHVADLPPRKQGLSTGQKRKSRPEEKKKGRACAPFGRGALGPVAQHVMDTLRRDWQRVSESQPALRWLDLHRACAEHLELQVRQLGAEEVLKVCRHALDEAAQGAIPPHWWSSLFSGQGFAARRAAMQSAARAEADRAAMLERASRPLTEIELRLLGVSA